ncbi:unnamed protein product [Effrenium voratum]|nr:unnamed protein product [Effrenium voratum]
MAELGRFPGRLRACRGCRGGGVRLARTTAPGRLLQRGVGGLCAAGRAGHRLWCQLCAGVRGRAVPRSLGRTPRRAPCQVPVTPKADLAVLQQVMVLDREALDTLSNFTTFLRATRPSLLGRPSCAPPVDVVVVTSEYHVPRVRALAWPMLGAQGLSFLICPCPGDNESEARWRLWRDTLRAGLWLALGFEGGALAALRHRDRRLEREALRCQKDKDAKAA